MSRVRLGSRTYRIPGPKPVRITIGVLLVLFGMVGFLPVVGFWMIPLGLLVLSIDSFRVRRLRRRLEVMWGRRRNQGARSRGTRAAGEPGRKDG